MLLISAAMAPAGACPAAEAIAAFLRGPVSLERRNEMEAHLDVISERP
jgi:hypothetical protein